MMFVLSELYAWFRPTLVALSTRKLPFQLRWRLLLLQPGLLLTYGLCSVPYLFSKPFTVEYLPIAPNRFIRALVFKASGKDKHHKRRPLHVDIHGGAFMGGRSESTAAFDERLARETGAVVVSISHRVAPEHRFPAAIDDVDAIIQWIQRNASERWNADPTLMTVGGFSAGGNLALASTQQAATQAPSPNSIKASVTFYAAIDLRLKPGQKPRPAVLPDKDPARVLFPLFDDYAESARAKHLDDPRLSPALASRESLPDRMLLVVQGLDILVAEQMAFAERINEEDQRAGHQGQARVQVLFDEKGFHGYLEIPDFVLSKGMKKLKHECFSEAVRFLGETYKLHGWSWDQE